MDFYKDVSNYLQITKILNKYEIENEKDVEKFDELINVIAEAHPAVPNLTMVLERILVFLVNRDNSLKCLLPKSTF
jgi:aspartyl-tRNA synthetase